MKRVSCLPIGKALTTKFGRVIDSLTDYFLSELEIRVKKSGERTVFIISREKTQLDMCQIIVAKISYGN